MKQFTVLKTFSHENMRCDAGVVVSLSDKQATFLLAGGFVEALVEVAVEVAPAKKAKAE